MVVSRIIGIFHLATQQPALSPFESLIRPGWLEEVPLPAGEIGAAIFIAARGFCAREMPG